MKNDLTYYALIFLIFLFVSCGTYNKKETPKNTIATSSPTDSLEHDTVELKETLNEEDIPVNDFLIDQLKPIRENFKKINSTKNWTFIDTLELCEAIEGGEAKYYYQNQQLEKIVTQNYGETFQQLTEYYLLNGQLSFVLEKSYTYNRPIYYDTIARKENNDTEIFDFEESEIQEDRSYFEKGELLHKIESADCGAPFATEYILAEQKRIKNNFDKLIGQTKRNEKPNR